MHNTPICSSFLREKQKQSIFLSPHNYAVLCVAVSHRFPIKGLNVCADKVTQCEKVLVYK